jgi:SAM-dependent methyltransferase
MATPNSQLNRSEDYTFNNAGSQTSGRLSALATVFDPGSKRHLTEVGTMSGWHCLEIGGGTGTIANWLCGRVGPSGNVLVTDIDTRFLDRINRPNLEVRKHDVTRDPLPEEAFDLVHTRLVLGHLPTRDAVLARLVTALKPGGWIVAEEFDSFSLRPDPWISSYETALKTSGAMQGVLARHGVDLYYGRRLPGRLLDLGLLNVSGEGRLFMYQGSSVAADLLQLGFRQLLEEMLAAGSICGEEIEKDLRRLQDPKLMMPGPIMWATRGQRPG